MGGLSPLPSTTLENQMSNHIRVTPTDNKWNIVLAGHWNIAIFRPDWVRLNVLKRWKNVELAIQIEPPDLVQNYKVRSLTLTVSANRLIITPLDFSDERLVISEHLASRCLNMLPHTPLTAFGVNFSFLTQNPTKSALKRMGLVPRKEWNDKNAEVRAIRRTESVYLDSRLCNATYEYIEKSNELSYSFNWHHEVNNPKEAKEQLKGITLSLKNRTYDILRDVVGGIIDAD